MECNMQITCANCKTNYSLTDEQIRSLSYSILPCKQCSKFIKITTCPYCQSYYSITFSSTQQTRYTLTCERCSKPFTIEFPIIREPKPANHEARAPRVPVPPVQQPERHTLFNGSRAPAKPAPTPGTAVKKEKASLFEKIRGNSGPGPLAGRPQPQKNPVLAGITGSTAQAGVNFTLSNLFSICGSAFTAQKLLVGSIGIVLSFLLVIGYNVIINEFFETGVPASGDYVRSILSIIPFALLFFIYILTASLISRITMDSMSSGRGPSAGRTIEFLGRSFLPVFVANIALFLAIELVFILFGRIPIVGPVLFALLFLPIYAASLCVILIIAIGFWFYPPIIAANSGSGAAAIRSMFQFIRRQNFSLAYTIPLMAIITAVTFAAIYILHYGSFSLSMYLTKHMLAEEGEKIFSAVPQSLLSISDLTILGSDAGLFKSLLSNLFLAHTIGGFIIGLIFSLISILLFSSFISISATLSSHLYIMMDRGTDIDDRSKLRVLMLLVLILAGVFLIKKIFF
jgi:hypothetical protein